MKPQLNVQEQIALKKQSIKRIAQYWRQNDLPVPIIQLLKTDSINLDNFIILWYKKNIPLFNSYITKYLSN